MLNITNIFGLNRSTSNENQLYLNESEKPKNKALFKKWNDLGLEESWFNNDFESAKFLIESKLIFTVIALANSSNDPEYCKGLLFTSGNLCILKEGKYVPVKELIKDIRYEKGRFLDSKKRSWTYVGKDGLIPKDSWNYKHIFPATKLAEEQKKALIKHAKGNSLKNCVIQVITHPRELEKKIDGTWKKNQAYTKFVHIGMRVIDKSGNVYSFGLHAPDEEMRYRNKKCTTLGSINAVPKMVDYEEPRGHEGRVTTSFAISEENCEKVLKKIERLQKKKIRADLIKQNCVCFAKNILQTAGIAKNLQTETDVAETIKHRYSIKISNPILNSLYRLVMSLCFNTLLIFLGRYRSSPKAPTLAGKEEGFTIYKRPEFKLFTPAKLHHSYYMIQWQLKQENTYVHPYEKPSMTIVPSEDPKKITEARRLKSGLSKAFSV